MTTEKVAQLRAETIYSRKSEVSSHGKKNVHRPTVPWANSEIIGRINRMRGQHLAVTGREVTWTELGRVCGWSTTTTSDVANQRRDIRVAEIALIGRELNCFAGWLAFAEGPITGESVHGRRDVTTPDPDAMTGAEFQAQLRAKNRKKSG